MFKNLQIYLTSLKQTLQELSVNKLRTFLSLAGVAFGIFCIIGVITTVTSLGQNVQDEINSLGSNSIYIDKWEYSGGPDKPMWKYRARPSMKYEEVGMLKQRSELMEDAVFLLQAGDKFSVGNTTASGAVYGITQAQIVIQPFGFAAGRYLTGNEFSSGTATGIIGYEIANTLFSSPERAIGKQVELKGRRVTVVGVIAKKGKDLVGWNYDYCLMLPYMFMKQVYDEQSFNPIIIAKGKTNVSTEAFSQELRGIMRQIRRLSPQTEDNFSLNSVEGLSNMVKGFFGTVNIAGAIIGGISLIVGMFGIANIMFVTVKERTPVIGLKKAIGAKKTSILMEFLMEAALLCLIGGLIGLGMVYLMTIVLSKGFDFPVHLSIGMLLLTFGICLAVGILAGIIPAAKASKLDPVVAIRS